MRSTGASVGTVLPAAGAAFTSGLTALPPYQTFNFAVEIEGLLVGGFTEVSGLDSEIAVEDFREGGVNDYQHRLPGATSYPNLVLKYGLTGNLTLWNWYAATTEGVVRRRNGTVMLLDAAQLPVMWWNFRGALPVRWAGPAFTATSDEVGVETLELVHQGLTRPVLGQALALARGLGG